MTADNAKTTATASIANAPSANAPNANAPAADAGADAAAAAMAAMQLAPQHNINAAPAPAPPAAPHAPGAAAPAVPAAPAQGDGGDVWEIISLSDSEGEGATPPVERPHTTPVQPPLVTPVVRGRGVVTKPTPKGRASRPLSSSDEEYEGDEEAVRPPVESAYPKGKPQKYPLNLEKAQRSNKKWFEYARVEGTCGVCGREGQVVKPIQLVGTGWGADQLWVRRCLYCGLREEVNNFGLVPNTKVAQTQTTDQDYEWAARGQMGYKRDTADEHRGGGAWEW